MAFCSRQAGLIHLEQVWEENKHTAEGRTLHERVDDGYKEFRTALRQFAGVRVRSARLGIYGRLDLLELDKVASGPANVKFLGLEGHWRLAPIEFKRGKPKELDCDRVQLCAQALCLEEMSGHAVEAGAIFYGEIRRRDVVTFTKELRERTEQVIQAFASMIESRKLPPPIWQTGCRACSLIEICGPTLGEGGKLAAYRRELLE